MPVAPLIINGTLLLPDGASSVRLSEGPGHIVIDDGRIVHVDPSRPSPAPDMGDEDCIIAPAFTDTHLHLPQFDAIGIDGLELLDWLERAIFPAEMKWADTEYAAAMAARVADELLSFGTTAVAAYATSHHAAAQAAINALAAKGLSGHVGQVLMDQMGPPQLLVPAPAALSQASTLKACGKIRPAVTPRFAVSCSDRLLRGSGELARRTGWYIQTHLSETTRECETVAGLHGGRGYVDIYQDAGLLNQRTLLGHGIHLSDGERETLSACGSRIAHCPTANRFLDAGVMHLARHERHRVRVCLGSDVGAGPDRSMVRVARAMIDAAKQAGNGEPASKLHIPGAREAWWRITAGNAAALGLEDHGILSPGCDADLVVIRPTKPWRHSVDPLAMLLYAWDDRWIESVLAQGQSRYSAPSQVVP
jgi:guanine deaminase